MRTRSHEDMTAARPGRGPARALTFSPFVALSAMAIMGGCHALGGFEDWKIVSEEAGDGGGPEAMQGPSQACKEYCATVMSACTDIYKVYNTEQNCLAVCALMDEGEPGDRTGNTVACRSRQATLAANTQEKWDHCAPAGPGGANICGDNCESYCSLYEQVCPEEQQDCMLRCQLLHDLDEDPKADYKDSTFDVVEHHEGDLLQCRLVHVSSAAEGPEAHCWHSEIAPRSLMDVGTRNPCTYDHGEMPRCEDYCRLNLAACAEDHAGYEDEEQCLAVCEHIPPGDGGDEGGQDTVGCRIAHSHNAFDDASIHCPHAGPAGAEPCGNGNNCEGYCRTVQAACGQGFESAFDSPEACKTACEMLNGAQDGYSVSLGRQGGDTYACRMLHAARAFADDAHCAAALGAAPCGD